jgi:hypothetical protein
MKYEASRETQHIIYIFDGPCSVWFSHGLWGKKDESKLHQ